MSLDTSKLIYWLLSLVVTIVVALAKIYQSRQNKLESRMEKVEAALSGKPDKEEIRQLYMDLNGPVKAQIEHLQSDLESINKKIDLLVENTLMRK